MRDRNRFILFITILFMVASMAMAGDPVTDDGSTTDPTGSAANDPTATDGSTTDPTDNTGADPATDDPAAADPTATDPATTTDPTTTDQTGNNPTNDPTATNGTETTNPAGYDPTGTANDPAAANGWTPGTDATATEDAAQRKNSMIDATGMETEFKATDGNAAVLKGVDGTAATATTGGNIQKSVTRMSKEEREKLEAMRAEAREAEKEALKLLKKGSGYLTAVENAIQKWNMIGSGDDYIRARWLETKKDIADGNSDRAVTTAMAAVEQATNSNLDGSGMAFAFHAMAEAYRAQGEETKAARYQMFADTAVDNIKDKVIRTELEQLIVK